MPRFTTRLIDRTEVADGTLAFAFERPAGFDFVAGQYLTITLPDPLYNDEKGNSRTFSIASPPQDAGRLVMRHPDDRQRARSAAWPRRRWARR